MTLWKVGQKEVKVPLIQGGMGVGISLGRLAGTVAKHGGVGIISTAQIGFREPDFDRNTAGANIRAIGKELKKARQISPDGIIGFNIMVALREYEQHVKEAVKCGADLIISGAGLPVDLPKMTAGSRTAIAPIVATEKSAQVILKYWDKKYQVKIPVIVAGGIYDNQDVRHAMELGADGVQAATRFVTTEECDADFRYKETYIRAKKEDIVIVKSPVGMPGRAILNPFMKRVMLGEKIPHTPCHGCLARCRPSEIPYCITDGLIAAAKGRVEDALLFCGENAYKAERIETVKEVMKAMFL